MAKTKSKMLAYAYDAAVMEDLGEARKKRSLIHIELKIGTTKQLSDHLSNFEYKEHVQDFV
ncbi:hypothetical protein [Granulicella arctica]|uniref:hypothetical protein n=1 Tax=Granulicella arctica TaxID=940613 RepID=UPI0021E03107|nr:hypothetical protein [Granulicella arctica]